MEEVHLRFSHLAEKIYGELNNQSLVKCKEVGLQWNHFLTNNKAYNWHKAYNWRVIKGYTDCSDALMKKLAKNAEDAIQITSDLQDIFKQFPTGTRQSSSFLMKWRSSPIDVAAENGYLKAYCLIMENFIVKQNGCNICESISEIIKGNILADEDFLIRKMCFGKTIYDWTPHRFATANSHVKNCKMINDFFSKNFWGLRSQSPKLNQVLDKAESTAAAGVTNPEKPAAKKLKTKKIPATFFDKDPISGLNQKDQK